MEEKREPVYISIASLSKKEREQWKKTLSPEAQKAIEEHEAEGFYDRCPKTDWCAKFNEERKRQEHQEVETLQQRNAILEAAARQQEAKQKEQEERLRKAEAGLDKLAGLMSQILSK